ncbi:hypothetical protein NRB_32390 [Novosphingobium sp. 11B]|nr:hypothetical protein GCM10017612_03270 [Novosphingobium resinovorum]
MQFLEAHIVHRAARRDERIGEHLARAAAHEPAHFLARDRSAAFQRKGVIDRVAKVAETVEKGSVEVETDDLKRKAGHCAKQCRLGMETATICWQESTHDFGQ